jgi:hypothetical protein
MYKFMSYQSHCKHKYVVSYDESCNGHLLYYLNFQPIHLMWLCEKRTVITMQKSHNCGKSTNKPSTSCVCTAFPKLLTSMEQGVKKIPVVPGSRPTLFFSADPIIFQRDWPYNLIFSRWLRAAHTACRNGVCCHTNCWTKLPKFVHRKYASLVNIDVGTLLQIAQQKTAKTMKKNSKKNLFQTYRP